MAHVYSMSAFMVALLVVATMVPWSSSSAALVPSPRANDECYESCAKYEKIPSQFAQCKDVCTLEGDLEAATRELDACNKACEDANKGGSLANVGKCMEICTIKADAIVGVAATRSCYRDCARDSKDPAALKKCEALCNATGEKGAAASEDMAAVTKPKLW